MKKIYDSLPSADVYVIHNNFIHLKWEDSGNFFHIVVDKISIYIVLKVSDPCYL